MSDNQDRTLVPYPSHELTVRLATPSRILSEMVESSLALVKELAPATLDLDALVREGKRLYLSKGEGMTKQNIQAFNLFFRVAVAGHSEAQYHVFRCYNWGYGIQKNPIQAEKWLREAAEARCPGALFHLAVAYEHGTSMQSIAKDENEAIKWAWKAAEIGRAGGPGMIAAINERRKDYVGWLEWEKKAAELV